MLPFVFLYACLFVYSGVSLLTLSKMYRCFVLYMLDVTGNLRLPVDLSVWLG
jgi:hypothetical protein